jgi:hypothetical protein
MTLKDYQFLLSIEGLTQEEQYEKQINYLGLSYERDSIDKIGKELSKVFSQPVSTDNRIRKYFYIKGSGIWKVANNIRKEKASQFTFFESFLYDKDEVVNNLHNILAIYIRPLKWYGIEKWDPNKHEHNANILLNADMKYVSPLINFFFLLAKKYMKNTNITSLNHQTREIETMMQNK